MWMDFSGYGLSPQEVHNRIYNKANVILEDGKMFGEEGLPFQRICLPSPRPIIMEAFERIARDLWMLDSFWYIKKKISAYGEHCKSRNYNEKRVSTYYQ